MSFTKFARIAHFYIPFCPRFYDRFTYREFAAEFIKEAKRSNLDIEDKKYLAGRMLELKKYDGETLYEPVKFAGIVYSEGSDNILLGFIGRQLIFATLCLSFTGDLGDFAGVYGVSSIITAMFSYSKESEKIAGIIKNIDMCLHWHTREQQELTIKAAKLYNEKKFKDNLIEAIGRK